MRIPVEKEKQGPVPWIPVHKRKFEPFAMIPKQTAHNAMAGHKGWARTGYRANTGNERNENDIVMEQIFDTISELLKKEGIPPNPIRAKRDYRDMVDYFLKIFSKEGLGKIFSKDLRLGRNKRFVEGALLDAKPDDVNKRLGKGAWLEDYIFFPFRFPRMKKRYDNSARSQIFPIFDRRSQIFPIFDRRSTNEKVDPITTWFSRFNEKRTCKNNMENGKETECFEEHSDRTKRSLPMGVPMSGKRLPMTLQMLGKRMDEMDASGFNSDTWNSKLKQS